MSKLRRLIFLWLAVFFAILRFFDLTEAKNLEANIKLESISPPVLSIEGKISDSFSRKRWIFSDQIAGIENLGARISDFLLFDRTGRKISVEKIASGDFTSQDSAEKFIYKVDLRRLEKITAMAHVSWVSADTGLLMLDDLLPQLGEKVSANIKFDLPDNWQISSNEKRLSQDLFAVEDVQNAVFFIGKNQRERNSASLSFLISGDWQFSEDEALKAAHEILIEYRNIFGKVPFRNPQIFLLKFPSDIALGTWEAETRGSNIVILSSDMPFKNQSIQRLHEQLRHEIFHFWIPNSLALTGDYAWFYEGFTLYQSLRTGVDLNYLRFEDFLDTLSRAYNLDNFQTTRLSMIEASRNRWNGANTQVYARGMLVGFLCDIALLKASKGKRSFREIFKEIYQKHGEGTAKTDGNSAILNILQARSELFPIVEKYIKGKENIAWQTDLDAFGIEASEENSFVKLRVKPKLNGRQKDLLNKLGYNNWRKIVKKAK